MSFRDSVRADVAPKFSARVVQVLYALSSSAEAAQQRERQLWQYALEICEMRRRGLDHTEIRNLLFDGYIEHGIEVAAAERNVQKVAHFVLGEQSCFVLTPKGADLIRDYQLHVNQDLRPHWDHSNNQLLWQNAIVKRFSKPAPNQKRILLEFERSGWPWVIDDPLPTPDGGSIKIQLDNTIKSLNNGHLVRALRFGGDGTGRGITWRCFA